MEFNVARCIAWSGNLQHSQDWRAWARDELEFQPSTDLPGLKQVPAMQRRRLSSFAKIALHCILEACDDLDTQIPCVFASRHGDLHKTAKLIEDVAQNEALSPTNFGLSVHNAVVGLYSIFSGNTEAMTAIASGEDTFFMALVDAYGKLNSGSTDKILVVYADEKVPAKYTPYVSDAEQNVAVALILTKCEQETAFDLSFLPATATTTAEFQPFAFLKWFFANETNREVQSSRYSWTLSKLK